MLDSKCREFWICWPLQDALYPRYFSEWKWNSQSQCCRQSFPHTLLTLWGVFLECDRTATLQGNIKLHWWQDLDKFSRRTLWISCLFTCSCWMWQQFQQCRLPSEDTLSSVCNKVSLQYHRWGYQSLFWGDLQKGWLISTLWSLYRIDSETQSDHS